MSIDKYLGIEKPEEKKEIEVEQNPASSLANSFIVWSNEICHQEIRYREDLDRILHSAETILTRCKLPEKVIDAEYFLPTKLADGNAKKYAGLFYTALLNIGATEYILIPKEASMNLPGYRMKQGVIDIYGNCNEAGWWASGGCVINRRVTRNIFYPAAENGFLINYGKIMPPLHARSICWYVEDSIFIDFDDTQSIFYTDYDSVIFKKGKLAFAKKISSFGRDPNLFLMLEELRSATEKVIDIKKVKTLHGKIKAYCKKNHHVFR